MGGRNLALRQGRALATLMVGLAVIGHGGAHLRAEERPTTPTSGSMRIRVVDAARAPIAKARVHASVWTKQKDFNHNRYYTTDEQGVAVVELPATLEIVRVWASRQGYAPMFAQLWPQTPVEEHPLPKDFTFELVDGTSMGGVVVDDDGKPIKGVRVEVRYDSGGVPGRTAEPASYDDWLAYGIAGRTSDSEGRWSLDNVPPGDDVEVLIKLSHRDFINDTTWGGLQKEQGVESSQFRNQAAKIVMHRGTVVGGTVTDPNGKPVQDAVVIWGDRPYWQEGRQEVHTDKQGTYHFEPLPTGPMRVTVVAQGWMPQMRKIDITPDTPPVDFQLDLGKKLRLRFVDAEQRPVPDVSVTITKWRGAESLYNYKHSNVVDVHIPRSANSNGIYEWDWAPDDAVEYRFSADHFAATQATITADGQEQVIELSPVFQISGTVRDAETGQTIPSFAAIPVIYFRPDFPYLPREDAHLSQDGTFRLEFDRTDIEHGVQIAAPGYVAFRTAKRYKTGEPNVELNVTLQPTEPYVGRVLDQQGKPVAHAKVYVATGFQHCDVYNLEDRSGSSTSNYAVLSDEAGAFEIAGQCDDYTLIVVAPEGYASVGRQAQELPKEVAIAPWANVRGRVVQNGQPMANLRVYCLPIRLRGGGAPWIDFRLTATTDQGGNFVFERVPPCTVYVRPDLQFSVESPLKSSQSVPLELAPGEEVSLELGGQGAEITGQLVLDQPRDDFDFHFSLTYLVARKAGINPPPSIAGRAFDWQAGWSDSWRHSSEGGVFLNTLHTWFVKPDPDGRFRISGVPPGAYQLAVALYGSTEGCLVHPVATRVVDVTVEPDLAVLEIGDLEIPTNGVPQVGDQAADFAFTTPTGETTDLTAQRGKYVLIDFWATWCGPCVAHLPETDSLRKRFADSGNLVVVGANLDPDPDSAMTFLAERPFPWHHALLGDWSSTAVPQQYGVSSIPAYVLVDPDGKIAALEYSLETLTPKIEAALSQRTAE